MDFHVRFMQMLTPSFSITQTDDYLAITIEAKFANIGETEIEYSEYDFVFSSSPYFLRLHLPSQVIDDETGTAKYDSDLGTFTVTVPKANKGEHFEGLDMITQLLRPQKATARPLVEEVIGSDEEVDDEEDDLDTVGDELLIDQTVHNGEEESTVDDESREYGYGFGWRRRGVFERLKDEIDKLIDLDDPEHTRIDERKKICLLNDKEKFNSEHYLADTFDEDEDMMGYISAWTLPENMEITVDDRERMKNLPNKILPSLSSSDSHSVSLSLIDILFAYAYDLRVNLGDISVESSWTYSHLSPSFSSLIRWDNASEAVHASARKCTVYPLYRNWKIVELVFNDVKEILKRGRSCIVHVLCTIHSEFISGGDFRYLLNELILTDLLIWIQSIPQSIIDQLIEELNQVKLSKSETGIDLETLEMEAKLSMMRMNGEGDQQDSDDD